MYQTYREIFGTDDIAELEKIANKAREYDALMEGRRVHNARNAGRIAGDEQWIRIFYKEGAVWNEA